MTTPNIRPNYPGSPDSSTVALWLYRNGYSLADLPACEPYLDACDRVNRWRKNAVLITMSDKAVAVEQEPAAEKVAVIRNPWGHHNVALPGGTTTFWQPQRGPEHEGVKALCAALRERGCKIALHVAPPPVNPSRGREAFELTMELQPSLVTFDTTGSQDEEYEALKWTRLAYAEKGVRVGVEPSSAQARAFRWSERGYDNLEVQVRRDNAHAHGRATLTHWANWGRESWTIIPTRKPYEVFDAQYRNRLIRAKKKYGGSGGICISPGRLDASQLALVVGA